jgi:hypothetical protein
MTRRRRGLIVFASLSLGAAAGAWAARNATPFLGAGLFLTFIALAARFVLHSRPRSRRIAVLLLLVLGLPPLVIGAHQLRCWHQSRPGPTRERLFEGVEYVREVIGEPHPAVVHILRVDLSTPDVRVLVTPPDAPEHLHAVRARTTSQFVREFGLQAAINGNNFFPFERRNPLTYWPYAHPLKGIQGGAASEGVQYGEPNEHYPILHITPDNRATIDRNRPRPWHTATAGVKHFIVDGVPIHMQPGPPEAVTAVGIDVTGRVLFLVVVDGDQAPYSVGIDRPTLTEVLLRHGVHNALGLDGGGSSTMVVARESGGTKLVNRPVQGTVPDVERPVGNHIGIYAPLLR